MLEGDAEKNKPQQVNEENTEDTQRDKPEFMLHCSSEKKNGARKNDHGGDSEAMLFYPDVSSALCVDDIEIPAIGLLTKEIEHGACDGGVENTHVVNESGPQDRYLTG